MAEKPGAHGHAMSIVETGRIVVGVVVLPETMPVLEWRPRARIGEVVGKS